MTWAERIGLLRRVRSYQANSGAFRPVGRPNTPTLSAHCQGADGICLHFVTSMVPKGWRDGGTRLRSR